MPSLGASRRGRSLGLIGPTVSAIAVFLAACSSSSPAATSASTNTSRAPASSSSAPTTSSATGPISTAQLQAMLLTVSDLPTGWAVDNSMTQSSSLPSCLEPARNVLQNSAYVDTMFQQNGSLPILGEGLTAASTTNEAVLGYAKVKNAFATCTTFTLSVGGQTVTGSMGALSFPTVGGQSAAFSAPLTVQGQTATLDFVLSQKGNVVALFFIGDYTVDPSQYENIVNTAMAKVVPTA